MRVLEEVRGDPRIEATVLIAQGLLEGMLGDFDRARSLLVQARDTLRDLGLRYWLQSPGVWLSRVEMLAGDPVAAELALQLAHDDAERLGETGSRAIIASHLAEAVYAQGRLDEAEELSRGAEALTDEFVGTQVRWRGVRAKILSDRGEHGEAIRLALEAVALGAETDALELRADSLIDLGIVQLAAGAREEGASALEEAVRLYEQKGNVVSARKATSLLQAFPNEEPGGGPA